MLLLSAMINNKKHKKGIMTDYIYSFILFYFRNCTVDILTVISHFIIAGVKLVKSSISVPIKASI